jgi:hypothetical protein
MAQKCRKKPANKTGRVPLYNVAYQISKLKPLQNNRKKLCFLYKHLKKINDSLWQANFDPRVFI